MVRCQPSEPILKEDAVQDQHESNSQVALSRRGFLKSTAAIAAIGSAPAMAQLENEPLEADEEPEASPIRAYVGTYTNHGQGIYLFHMNPSTGGLRQIKVFTGISNPSWLAIHPNKKYLYAANEDFSPPIDTISAFAIDQTNGDLSLLNMRSAEGYGPAHISVHPAGKHLLVSNYGSGDIAVLPINPNGSLGNATDARDDVDACVPACPVGPPNAAKAPPGSFAISGHDAPHAHMIESDPNGNFVLVNDLGLDLTIIWKFDENSGTLSDPKTVPSSPGAGPRHFAFHPNGRWFYSLNEEASTLAFMIYNPNNGSLNPVAEISTLPPAFVGTNFTSEVILSHDGNFVYCANRLHDTIAIFEVLGNGLPKRIGEIWTRGDYPRNIAIDPTGQFMFACNHRGDAITSFRIEDGGSKLTFTGKYTPVGSPAIITFL
jgi:6-phosphogluconolactonase (cycloisomerase 2 family)